MGNQFIGEPKTYYMFTNVGAAPIELAKTVPMSIFAMYELCFPLLASTILGCMLGSKFITLFVFQFSSFNIALLKVVLILSDGCSSCVVGTFSSIVRLLICFGHRTGIS
jgi:hypothetical protein